MMVFQPSKLPVVILILPFILLFAAFYTTWGLFDMVRVRYITKKPNATLHRQLGGAVSLSAVLLVILQSLGQLTLRDVLTVVAIVLLGYAYVARNKAVLSKK